MSDLLTPERLARVALTRLSEPGDVRLSDLVAQMGATRVYELLREEQDISGVYTDVAARLRGLDPVRDLEQAASAGIRAARTARRVFLRNIFTGQRYVRRA